MDAQGQQKKTAKLIVAEKLGTKKEPEEKKSGDEGKLSAAEDLIKAVKEGDAQGVADALSAFHTLSEPDGDEE